VAEVNASIGALPVFPQTARRFSVLSGDAAIAPLATFRVSFNAASEADLPESFQEVATPLAA
jgi:hypothetical protein